MKWILIRSYEPLERGPGRGTSHDKALKYMLQNLTKGRLSAVGYRTGEGDELEQARADKWERTVLFRIMEI